MSLGIAAGVALGLPYFAKVIPWSFEKRISSGLGGFEDLRTCVGEGASRTRFDEIVKRIYPLHPLDEGELPIQVEVVSGTTVNAFATLGGRIYVFDGLLQEADSPEEIAGILAHEIEHVHQRHVIQSVLVRLLTVEGMKFVFSGSPGALGPEVSALLLHMHFTKQQENKTDRGGLQRLQKAEVDVTGLQHFFERLERSGDQARLSSLLSDHPSNSSRVELTRKYSGGAVRPILNRTDWLEVKKICR